MFAAQGPSLAAQGYTPVTMIGDLPAFGLGTLRSPPGWRPQSFWNHRRMADGGTSGVIIEYMPPAYVVQRGVKGARRVSSRWNGKPRRLPQLIRSNSFTHEQELRARGCIPVNEMPIEMLDLIINYHGPNDLPPEIAEICRERMKVRKKRRSS